eukprot:3935898-Rhodomonas_salina.1
MLTTSLELNAMFFEQAFTMASNFEVYTNSSKHRIVQEACAQVRSVAAVVNCPATAEFSTSGTASTLFEGSAVKGLSIEEAQGLLHTPVENFLLSVKSGDPDSLYTILQEVFQQHNAISGAYNAETTECTLFVTQSQTLLLMSVISAIVKNTFYWRLAEEVTVAPVHKDLSLRAAAFVESKRCEPGGADFLRYIAAEAEEASKAIEQAELTIDLACHETLP